MSSNQKTKQKYSTAIVKWYRKNARDLPWRRTQDPYKIWLSEIMLQQTTVAQGTDYYLRFLEKFPTIKTLAQASQDEVLKQWEGLGYYSRARNLHHTAQYIYEHLDGTFPSQYDDIKALKGVGDYTAAAIASFVYGLPYVVMDGNVLRVMSRLYGITEAVDIPKTKKQIKEEAQQLLECQDPAEFNQAIMEFGALLCTFKNPGCTNCPLRKSCVAYAEDMVGILPKKSKKIKKRKRFFVFHHITDPKNRILIEQRGPKDVWQGLYQFPLLELDGIAEETSKLHPLVSELSLEETHRSSCLKQTLTHQNLECWFVKYKAPKAFPKALNKAYEIITPKELDNYGFPRVINTYLGK